MYLQYTMGLNIELDADKCLDQILLFLLFLFTAYMIRNGLIYYGNKINLYNFLPTLLGLIML